MNAAEAAMAGIFAGNGSGGGGDVTKAYVDAHDAAVAAQAASDAAGKDITATANSSDIALTDSADARVHDLKIYGKTEDGHSVGENGLTVTEGGGYNLWDEQWETGTYSNSTGEKINTDNNRIRSKNLIAVAPNTTYYVTITRNDVQININAYDENGDFLGWVTTTGAIQNTWFNTYKYNGLIRFIAFWTYSGTKVQAPYNYGITINKSDAAINGKYYPYETNNFSITTALPLRGIYNTVDLGTLNWFYETTAQAGDPCSLPRFSTNVGTIPDAYIPSVEFGVEISSCSSRYTPAVDPVLGGNTDKTICFGKGKGVYIVDHDYTDAAAFKAAVTGIILTYPSYCDEIDLTDGVAITRIDSNGDVLAEPVTTPLTDAEKAAFDAFRTFEGTTNITATDDPHLSLTYVKNTENGKALANVDDRALSVKSVTYTGTGATSQSITFPETPFMIIGFTQSPIEERYTRGLIPFIWDRSNSHLCICWSDTQTSSGTYQYYSNMRVTLSGNTMSWTASDTSQALNVADTTYTVYYI